MTASHSKEFYELVKSIGESRSKQEEDSIILREVAVLKQKMAARDVTPAKMKEYLIRMIYVEMLGHDASFAYIHAVKMMQARTLVDKRVGYLACSLVLHPDHSFVLLIIGSIQRDLKSEIYLESCMGLQLACKVMNTETAPALFPMVVSMLEHKQALVRKKAVMALQRFHMIDNTTCNSIVDKIRRVLSDRDPSVMGASLNLLHDMIRTNAQPFKDLVPSFVNILGQVLAHRLPHDYEYHRTPAPWIQIRLLQILALLGANDKSASENMYDCLQEVLKAADTATNVGCAITYECIRTITSIYPHIPLLDAASSSISRFISAENHNLKYLGLNSLVSIVQINPKYAAEHQLTVIDCLEDPDDTLKRKTLDLLYSMTNPLNVIVIVDKLTGFLRGNNDAFLRTELVTRISQLAEKYAPSHAWYIQTMNNLFELGGDLVRTDMAHSLMRLLADAPAGGDLALTSSNPADLKDVDIRAYAVDVYVAFLRKATIPDLLLQVIAWVLGEFGHLSQTNDNAQIASLLIGIERRSAADVTLRAYVMAALQKTVARMEGTIPSDVRDLVDRYRNSMSADLQQRAYEFHELLKTPVTLRHAQPRDGFGEDVKVDIELSFTDAWVAAASTGPAVPRPKMLIESKDTKLEGGAAARGPALKFTAYEAAATVSSTANFEDPRSPPVGEAAQKAASAPGAPVKAAATGPQGLDLSGVSKKWGAAGYDWNEPVDTSSSSSAASTPAPVPPANRTVPTASTAVSVATTPVPVPQQQVAAKRVEPVVKPRELTEREKMAALLFGGTSSAVPAAAAGVAKRGATTTPVVAPTPAKVAAPVVAAKTAATVAPAKGGAVLNLLDDSVFGALVNQPVVTPTPVVPVSSSSSHGGFELSFLDSHTAVETKSNVVMGADGMSAAMRARLDTLTKTSTDTLLINDERLQVTSYKALATDRTIICFFVSNKTPSPLSNVTVQISGLATSFIVAFEGDSGLQARGTDAATFAQIPAHSTATLLASIQCREPLSSGVPACSAAIIIAGSSPLPCGVPLSFIDLLRPVTTTTAQFGSAWKAVGNEVKRQIVIPAANHTMRTCADLMNRIKTANLFPIQTIGQENIIFGKLVSAAKDSFLVLLHARMGAVAPVPIDITIRTSSRALSSTACDSLAALLLA